MTTLSLAPRIALARAKTRKGEAWLDIISVLAFALSALMALTVAGGIWMFWQIHNHTPQAILSSMRAEMADTYTSIYMILAFFAGALLVVPVFSLGSSAARLGARGRTRTLASLRLVGLTTAQTTLIAVAEMLAHWVVGTVIGLVTYYASLPLWHNIHFFKLPIDTSLMRVPLWVLGAVIGGLLLVALASTIVGLGRLRISPLGVARREETPALKIWRVGVFVLALVVALVWASGTFKVRSTSSYIIMVLVISGLLASITVVGPFLLQCVARPFAHSKYPSVVLAARRIVDDPRATWRMVGTLALLGFIAGYVSPVDPYSDPERWVIGDVRTGVLITLAFSFAVASISTLMNQASGIFDRLDQTTALRQMGFPRRVFGLTRMHEVMAPLIITASLSTGLGLLLMRTVEIAPINMGGLYMTLSVLGAGIVVTYLALLVCNPLEQHVLETKGRKND